MNNYNFLVFLAFWKTVRPCMCACVSCVCVCMCVCVCVYIFSFFFYWLFYLHVRSYPPSQLSPLSPPRSPLPLRECSPLPSPSPPCLSTLAFFYSGASSLHRIRATPPIDVRLVSPWELWGLWSVDIVVAPMGLLTPSAPSVLLLAPPLGSPCSVRRLAACICVCIGHVLSEDKTAIPTSCQQALLGISNSVWVWCQQMGWIPR